jgi:predicted transcriptional regulator YdeE
MLRVTVELVPFGIESNSKEIFTLLIGNDGTGTQEEGNYTYYASEVEDDMKWAKFRRHFDTIELKKGEYKGRYVGFSRKRTAKELVMLVLMDIFNKEKEKKK